MNKPSLLQIWQTRQNIIQFLVAPAKSSATCLLIVVSLCLLACLFCRQLWQLLTPGGYWGDFLPDWFH